MAKIEIPEVQLVEETSRLEDVLRRKGVDTSRWKPENKCKTVRHLAREILEGDTDLQNQDTEEALLRITHVVNLYVYAIIDDRLYKLVEDRQVMKDEDRTVRRRGLGFLSEKRQVKEPVLNACVRAMEEEISLEPQNRIRVLGENVERVDSPSFPGLESEYHIHRAETFLTEEQYDPAGYIEDQEDKTTYFVWKLMEEAQD